MFVATFSGLFMSLPCAKWVFRSWRHRRRRRELGEDRRRRRAVGRNSPTPKSPPWSFSSFAWLGVSRGRGGSGRWNFKEQPSAPLRWGERERERERQRERATEGEPELYEYKNPNTKQTSSRQSRPMLAIVNCLFIERNLLRMVLHLHNVGVRSIHSLIGGRRSRRLNTSSACSSDVRELALDARPGDVRRKGGFVMGVPQFIPKSKINSCHGPSKRARTNHIQPHGSLVF